MSEHEHRWWARYRAVGIWRNQYGCSTRIKPDGCGCSCGARLDRDVPLPSRSYRRRQRRALEALESRA